MRLFKFDIDGDLRKFEIVCWAIVEINKRIILIQHSRKRYHGRWGFPFAHLHLNEPLLKAPVRALRETTGLWAEPISLVSIFRLKGDREARNNLHFAFVLVNPKGKIKISGEKIIGVQTFDFHQIQKMSDASLVHPEIKQILKIYHQGISFPLDLIYEVGYRR